MLCWLNGATLSKGVLAHVVGLFFARVVWFALEKQFSSSSGTQIIQMKFQLQGIKKGNHFISEYI